MDGRREGGGWQAIGYTVRKAFQVGPIRLWKAMRSNNACKTCAVGMGGQSGGMRNEAGRFPEVCKKSVQAMAADMQGKIAPEFFEAYSLSQLRNLSPRELEACGRLAYPLIAGPGDTHFRVASWDEAISAASHAMGAAKPERSSYYSSGRTSNEAGFLLQLIARLQGTNHVSNCSYYCHQASAVGLSASLGAATATIELDDLESCDAIILIGGNPASNHPRLMTQLVKLRERGGTVIVVNPAREGGLERFRVPSNVRSLLFGSDVASLYVQPRIGGDIALFAGMAKRLIDRGAIHGAFIQEHTEGFSALKSYVESLSWDEIVACSGVSRQVVEQVADAYARSEHAVLAWTMGITHHLHGVENVQWIVNLALLRGMVGKKGAGLLPIRGHSNVQGIGSVGVSPAIKEAALAGLKSLGIVPPAFSGYDTLAALEAAARGEMDFALCLGGNLFGASPDSGFVTGALGQVGTIAYLNTSLNTGHVHGMGKTTVVFPVLARDEEPQPTTQESMFNYVRLSDGGKPRFDGARSEVDVLCAISEQALPEQRSIDWKLLRAHDGIRSLIAKLVPNLAEIERIAQTRKEFQIPGRVLHEPNFATPSGKAAFAATPIPPPPAMGEDELLLMTVRSEGQFNTVVFEELDIYRGQDRRDVVLMNPADMTRLGLSPDQPVAAYNDFGEVACLARPYDIAQGCTLMYYPEANCLVGREADPRSKTPAFKAAKIRVRVGGPLRDAPRTSGEAATRANMNAC